MPKDFDCVEMKRRGQERLRQRLAGMTPEQVAAFWARRNREFEESIRRSREQTAQKRSA